MGNENAGENYAEMSVRFRKRDVTKSRYGQNISSRSSSRRLEQVLTKE